MFKHAPNEEPHFTYYAPLNEMRAMISIPHSGLEVPKDCQEFLSKNEMDLNCDVDYAVHELIDIEQLRQKGFAIIVYHLHRTCIDLNRARDLAVFNWKENSQGTKIVLKEPTPEVIEALLEKYYDPYFEVIKTHLVEFAAEKKRPLPFYDLHSMPSEATAYHLRKNPKQEKYRKDFCLSDRHGLTCTPEFIQSFKNNLEKFNYQVAINDPYIGGYITEFVQHYPSINIQIEINRKIYMDEKKIKLLPALAQELKEKLTNSFTNHLILEKS